MKNEQFEILKSNSLSGLRGLVVVSQKEGKLLGKVSHVFIDPKEKKLSGVIAKDEFWSKERLNVPLSEINSFGEDVIFINSETKCKVIKELEDVPGISLKALQGHGVITQDGKDLGKFEDANFNLDTWTVSDLYLSGDKALKVEASEIIIGEDEILVPSNYSSQLKTQTKKHAGILSRFFGEDEKELDKKEVKISHQENKRPKRSPQEENVFQD